MEDQFEDFEEIEVKPKVVAKTITRNKATPVKAEAKPLIKSIKPQTEAEMEELEEDEEDLTDGDILKNIPQEKEEKETKVVKQAQAQPQYISVPRAVSIEEQINNIYDMVNRNDQMLQLILEVLSSKEEK